MAELPWDNDSPYADPTAPTDMDEFLSLADKLSPLVDKLRPILTDAFGSALQGQFGMPGLTQGYGSTSLFGNQNVGLNMMFGAHTNAVNAAMGDSAQNVAQQVIDLKESHIRVFGTGPDGRALTDAEVTRLANAPLSAIGLAAGTLFNTFQQPEQLLQGIREGIQYMGVTAAPTSQEHQIALRKQTTAMSMAMTDSLTDPLENAKFGFLSGQDRGRLFAELSRGGAFNELRSENRAAIDALGSNASDEDVSAVMDRLGADTVKTVQDAGRAIQSFRQFFKGSVTDVMDQVNGLLGTDVMRTFQGAESEMFMRLGATGLSTGQTAGQMYGLAGMAHQYSGRHGNPLWGSAAAGTIAGQLIGIHRQTGTNEFINEKTFRENTAFNTEGSMHSALAKGIRGAYAMAISEGGEAGGIALDEALAASPVRSLSDVARIAGGVLGENVSSFSLSNWGDMPDARRLLGSDQRSGTIQATMLKAMYEGEEQRRWFELSLGNEGGLGPGQVAAVMKRAEGAMTISELMDAIPEGLMSKGAMWNVGGFMHKRAAMGDQSSEAQQARIAMGLDVDTRNLITGNVGSNVQLMQLLQGKGAHGIAGFNAFIQEIDKQGTGLSLGMKGIIGQFLGKESTNVNMSDVAGFIGASEPMLKWMEEHGTDKEKQGLAIIWEGLAAGVGPGGKNISSAQLKNFRSALQAASAGPEDEGASYNTGGLVAIAEKYYGMSFDEDGNLIRAGGEKKVLDQILKLLQSSPLGLFNKDSG